MIVKKEKVCLQCNAKININIIQATHTFLEKKELDLTRSNYIWLDMLVYVEYTQI